MTTQTQPDFIEALCTAWVRGWYHGVDGIKNDDGKRAAAAEIAEDPRFSALVAAPDLAAALDAILGEVWDGEKLALRDALSLSIIRDKAEAALAKCAVD